MIREFTPAEDAEVQALQRDCQVGAWLIPVGYRAGLKAGARRMLAAAEAASTYSGAIAAMHRVIEDEQTGSR